MFLRKYISNFYFEQVRNNYEDAFFDLLDEENFLVVYQLFLNYHFYFIEDIILSYLEIFTLEVEEVELGLKRLKQELGDNFVYLIGNNLTYLDRI